MGGCPLCSAPHLEDFLEEEGPSKRSDRSGWQGRLHPQTLYPLTDSFSAFRFEKKHFPTSQSGFLLPSKGPRRPRSLSGLTLQTLLPAAPWLCSRTSGRGTRKSGRCR